MKKANFEGGQAKVFNRKLTFVWANGVLLNANNQSTF